jgi:hypothetical protein
MHLQSRLFTANPLIIHACSRWFSPQNRPFAFDELAVALPEAKWQRSSLLMLNK